MNSHLINLTKCTLHMVLQPACKAIAISFLKRIRSILDLSREDPQECPTTKHSINRILKRTCLRHGSVLDACLC